MLYTHPLAGAEPVESGRAPRVLPALPARPVFTCACSPPRAGGVSVHLTGELDLATACQLERALRDAQAEASEVVLDLRDLTFLDCSGMRVILGAARRAKSSGHRLTVCPGPAQVDRVFTLTGAVDAVDMSAGAC